MEVVESLISNDFHTDCVTFQKIVCFADRIEVASIPVELVVALARHVENTNIHPSDTIRYRYSARRDIIDGLLSHLKKSFYGASLVEVYFVHSSYAHLLNLPQTLISHTSPHEAN